MKLPLLIIFLLIAMACTTDSQRETEESLPGTFGHDLQFLSQHDPELVILTNAENEATVLVSARYQGKVFTSTTKGSEGPSFGWVNYKAFEGEPDVHMNAYGGENRLWLGPEGGKFSLFFEPGTPMEFSHWRTPSAVDTEAWTVLGKNSSSVSMEKSTELINYSGTKMKLTLQREVSILNGKEIGALIQDPIANDVKVVGYSTRNSIINTGLNRFDSSTGAPCLWMLDMFVPSPEVTILLPYREAEGKVATTDYFGEVSADRITYKKGVLYFKADGKSRGKIGLSPSRARSFAGSYDAKNLILTITFYDVDPGGIYLNQEWEMLPDPYRGDAVNAYNDGPLEDGSQMGPFYELESVSPAAFLAPGEKLEHHHSVVHLTGNKSSLDRIARKVFGASLAEIENALK